MALITLNPMFERIQRKLGNTVFRRTHSGKIAATKVADTPAYFAKQSTRRCKCVQGEVEQSTAGASSAHQAGGWVCTGSHGRP